MADRAYLERLTKELTEQGKLIEAGWIGLRLAILPDSVPGVQLDEMRKAFFAGAAHLFASINTILDPGEEPTEADLTRMDNIHRELQAFEASLREFMLRAATPRPRPKQQHTLGDAPIEDKYRDSMQAMARTLDEYLNPGRDVGHRKVGFVVLLFEYGSHDGRANYISNGASRRDIVALFKEQIARFEGQPDVEGHA
jgi:hypothetical protein